MLKLAGARIVNGKVASARIVNGKVASARSIIEVCIGANVSAKGSMFYIVLVDAYSIEGSVTPGGWGFMAGLQLTQ